MGRVALLIVWVLMINCLCIHSDDNNSTRCIEEERQALLTFKDSFKGPYIQRRLQSWQGHDCCDWNGLSCDKSTRHVLKLDLRAPLVQTLYYESTRYVFGLDLEHPLVHKSYYDVPESLVAEEVDSSLMKLKYLKYLDLSGNSFQGSSIPQFLGQMKRLTYLNLSFANFSGRVPNQLGNLSNLEFLDLHNRARDGYLHVDDLRWVSSLSSLKYFDIGGASLSRVAPKLMQKVFTQLPSLLHLGLSACELSSHLFNHPSTNFTFLPLTLRFLDLSSNYFFVMIPDSLQNLTSLEVLDLSDNYFSFSVPLWLKNLKNLKSLCLARNDLSSLDNRIELILRNLSNLHSLDLSTNQLTGIIPASLGRLISLSSLDLSNNQFAGIIPSSFGRLISLSSLDLSNNQFAGIIPSSFGRLTSLSFLDLSNNQFTGIIPSSFGRLASLNFLDMSTNQFTGIIQSSFGRLESLNFLDLSNNQFSGIIPSSFGRLASLSFLDLSNNQFSGIIPPSFGRLTSLSFLHMSNNQLIGIIPSSFGRLTSLNSLVLSNNQITEIIPPSLGRLEALTYLDLSHNKLNGTISASLGQLSNLMWLDLSKNRFHGIIPDSIGQLGKLIWLDLDSNVLEGVVSSDSHLLNLSSLYSLQMGNNHDIKLHIHPNWIPPFQLRNIELRSCKFEPGQFPIWVRTQNQLRVLDLSNTSISDMFPHWLLEDNPHLCGLPLLQACPKYNPTINGYGIGGDGSIEDKEMDSEKIWFYVVVMAGYAIGFWTVVGVLLVKKSWRHAYFTYVDEIKDKVYMVVEVKMGALKKKMKKTKNYQPQ